MRKTLIKTLKIISGIVVAFLLVLALDIAVLAYPHTAFDYNYSVGSLNFYSDKPFDSKLIRQTNCHNQR